MDYGIQLYSIRNLAKENFEEAIAAASRIGYSSIEFAGFFGRSAEAVNRAMDNAGIRICGTHSGWGELANDYENTLRFHKEIGNKHYTIPGADLSTPEKLKDFCEFLNFMTPKLAAETNVKFEIDTYWAFVGGEDPVAVLEKYAHRMSLIHLKDGSKEGRGKSLGLGEAPLSEVVSAAKRLGLYMIVESEGQEPDGPAEITRCIDWLKING